MPNNIQFVPYIKVKDTVGGKTIKIECTGSANNGKGTPSHEYITKASASDQEFEGFTYMTAGGYRGITFTIPSGIQVTDLKYRETSYDIDFRGSFNCSDGFFDLFWTKARRTALVCMRDTLMGCPDRERGGWLEDQSPMYEYIPYCFNPSGYTTLLNYCIYNFKNWQHADGVIPNTAPSGMDPGNCEDCSQELAWAGEFGLWGYYMQTGNVTLMTDLYLPVKNCLARWSFDADGLISYRTGYGICGDWMDWGNNIDRRCLMNAQYYSGSQTYAGMGAIGRIQQ